MRFLKTRKILTKKLDEIKPSKKETETIKKKTNNFCKKLEKEIKKNKIKADVFVGGSLAKKTILKKEDYDIDIFVRFDKKYSEKELPKLLENVLKKFCKNIKKLKGSRNYFQVDNNIKFEVVPVIKINKPEEARNVTDLSYFHVKYIENQVERKKNLEDEIILAKYFCYAQKCYGAESHIKGFSGYGLELIVSYYGGFLKFIKKIAKTKKKLIIDPEKHYKNKEEILTKMNESKLQSPIIFVDPTYKKRNAMAGLSEKTFQRFQKTCRNFLKNPSEKFFERKEVDVKKWKQKAKKQNGEFLNLEIKTKKQSGDIAGSKMLKFCNFLEKGIGEYFYILKKEFVYEGGKTSKYYLILKKKNERILTGPPVKMKKEVKKFKEKNKNKKIYQKEKRFFAKEKINFSSKKFIENFKKNNKKIMKSMDITGLKINY